MRSRTWELVSRFQALPLISRIAGARGQGTCLWFYLCDVRDFGYTSCQLCMAMISWEDDLRHPGGGSGVRTSESRSTNSAALMSVGQIRARGQRGEDYSLVSWMETWTKEPTPDAYLHLRATHAGILRLLCAWTDLQVATQRESPAQSAKALPTRIFSWVTGVPACYQTRATTVCQIRVWWQADKRKPDNPKL